MSDAYAEWVARGRAHQAQERPVDALLCYRRALRERASAPEALFHLGEALWQIGRLGDAIEVWRRCAAANPEFAPAWQALAEAALGMGDAAQARDAAMRMLQTSQSDPRSRAVAAIAALELDPDAVDTGPEHEMVVVIEGSASVLSVPVIGGALARALDRKPRSAILGALRRAATVANATSGWPLHLLALAVESIEEPPRADAFEAVFAGLLALQPAPAEIDHWRRAAAVARRIESAYADELNRRYASIAENAWRSRVPLLWPNRTAGGAMRIVLLVPSRDDPSVERWIGLARALPGSDVTVARPAAEGLAASVQGDTHDVVLSAVPGLDDARRLAALDADVLVDLAGLAAPVGALLAARPARRIVTLESVPLRNVAPLVDACYCDLEGACVDARSATRIEMTAAQLRSILDDAVAAHQRGDVEQAAAGYQRILAVQPESAPVLHLLGVLERDRGHEREAGMLLSRAVAAAPDYDDARIASLALAPADDAARLRELSAVPPSASTALLRSAGAAALRLRQGALAERLLDLAVRRDPTDAQTHFNLGVALQMQRRHGDAARAYQRALAFRPDLIEADFNLAVVFDETGNRPAALSAYGAVLARDPKHAAAYRNRGEILLAQGQVDAYLDNFRRFEANCPNALPLAVQALEACQYAGDHAQLERYLDGLRDERYAASNEAELCDGLEQLLYLVLYFDVEPGMIHRFAQTYDATARRVYGERLPPRTMRRPGRIRVGYLSGDFRNHVMGKMMWQAVEHHDRSRFELHFLSLSAERDPWTERFEALADDFEVLAHFDERTAAQRIAERDLDLLIDLSAHTKGAKPGILALKPARVQVTHVASAGTVGLSTIDHKLTDRYADLPENQATQIEPLLAMQGCVYPYRHIDAAPLHPFHRRNFDIGEHDVVLGAFVSAMKLSRRCLALWRTVLERIPQARLAFSPTNAAFRDVYLRLVNGAAIAPDRVFFVPQGRDDAENQARYNLVDFVLDPMPYGGANGTLEALDAGVPVVTLVGKRHCERTSFSILSNAGVTQTIAHGGSEYVAIAERLAHDAAFMRETRAAIRAGIASSPLTDMRAHTRNLEAAYLEALRVSAPEVLASTSTLQEA